MNRTMTTDATSGNLTRTGNWATRGAAAAGQGIVLFGFTLADPDTWRSLLWSTVDILVGWVLTLAPAGLLAWGLFGLVMPAVWHPIVAAHGNNWYAFIHVTTASTAWLAVALGIAFMALSLLLAPWLLRRYAALAQSFQILA